MNSKFLKSFLPVLALCAVLNSCSPAKSFKAATDNNFPVLKQNGKTAIVAHRGFWKCEAAGFSENSIASLKAAQDAGCWGSECDIHITADDQVIVNHNNDIAGLQISDHTLAELREHLLPNGEKRPTLDEYLDQAALCPTTVLVIEFKIQKDNFRDDLLIEKTIAALKAHNLYDPSRIVFISFGKHTCDMIALKYPKFVNQYLSGKTSPEELASKGINGIDYHYSNFYLFKDYVQRAHNLGMSVNAWTVDKKADIKNMIDLGVDQITTNEPLVVRELLGDKEFSLKK